MHRSTAQRPSRIDRHVHIPFLDMATLSSSHGGKCSECDGTFHYGTVAFIYVSWNRERKIGVDVILATKIRYISFGFFCGIQNLLSIMKYGIFPYCVSESLKRKSRKGNDFSIF